MTQDTIAHLAKVVLEIQEDTADNESPPQGPALFEFVLGVASEGLCPFESRLLGKKSGATLHLKIPKPEIPAYFGHLLKPLRLSLSAGKLPDFWNLHCSVQLVQPASDREVIQAMAEAVANGGCGDDCGCGCSC